MTTKARIPILITWDVDPDRWTTLDRRRSALNLAMDLCQEFDIRSTFFITARFAHEYPDELQRMQVLGQEVGCHGLTHTDEEEYDRMSEVMQRAYIEEATSKLESTVGKSIRVFRSPRVKTSATTLRLLTGYGYLADSSVCSQRLDIVSSNLINLGWLLAPRRPYRPHHASAYKQGSLPIWEVPVSALIVPFTSKVLNVLGLPATRFLATLLCAESRCTGKPIVYLSHPTEFLSSSTQGNNRSRGRVFKPAVFSPRYIRTHGFLARNLLLRMEGKALFDCTRELFAYMASLPHVKFMTTSEYITEYLVEPI